MNTIILNVKGKNIENFIYKLHHKGIDLLNITYISRKEVNIEIYDSAYDLVNEIKGIYEIEIIKYKGIKRIKKLIKYHKYLIISILIGLGLLICLTNIIYDIEIVYSGSNMKNMLLNEMKSYGLTKYSIAKSFDDLEKIKNQILIDRKDELEWLMIERVGTKYIVRLEPRKINKINEDDKKYNIVATKDVVIRKIESSSGEVIKNIGDYVKKGDIVISSNITLNDNIMNTTSASGKIYGEVWYKVSIEYPLNYYEEKTTGNTKTIYNVKVFNRYIGKKNYEKMKIEDHYILKSDILPIGLNRQIQKEIEIINYKLSYEEAIEKAKEAGRNKINDKLEEDEYIIDEKSLKCELKDSKIVIDMFYTVYEDVTGYVEIEGSNDIQQ